MTQDQLRAAIETLGTSQAALARLVGVNPRTMRRWIAGDSPIPRTAAILIRTKVAAIPKINCASCNFSVDR